MVDFHHTKTLLKSKYSTGASDRSFYPIFNKRFDHLESLLTIHRPKKSFASWVTVRAFSDQSPV